MSAPVSAETGEGAPTETSPESTGDPTAPPPGDEGTGAATTPPEQNAPDVDALRAELAEWRSKAEGQQSVVDKIAAALGIGTEGTPPTVEQVTDQLTAAQTEARERAVDLAVFRAAPAANADPDALLDSTAFRRRVADLDPADAKFGEQVAAAIADAVKANPRLATTSAAPQRSGGEITGGSPTTSDDLGSLSVEDYIKRTRKRGN
ncbi:hypothetical protein [Lentzea aerocolonigenes]|uniref:hypothetical protein n=1 Tax=Lentzea aerocolonigenes TaxID=68170 RepID=UPI000696E7BE|nr:hypothetical protein [Lentzea aerocolonigenes]